MDGRGEMESMRIMKSPQIRFDDIRFAFLFGTESVTATIAGQTDTFDFYGFPDGEIESFMVETDLPYNPIIRAKKTNGVLSVELMNFIGEHASEEEKFPEWEEH